MYDIRHFKHKGRGLVATEHISQGAPIVTCPVIVYDDADAGRISKTRLGDYNFRFGQRQNRACIVLGVISLCNHLLGRDIGAPGLIVTSRPASL